MTDADDLRLGPMGIARGRALTAGFWLVRTAASVLVGVLVLTGRVAGGQRVLEIILLVLAAGFMVCWGLLKWRPRSTPWPLVVTLAALGAVGGLGAALTPANSMVAFALMAALAAGRDLQFLPACGVTAAGVLGVAIGGALFGLSTARAVGLPLVLVIAVLAGRTYLEIRRRADQATVLLAQMQLTQQEQRRAATLDERNRIAREIHDVLAHSISALGIQIETARTVLDETGDTDTASKLLEYAQRLADDGLLEARRAVHALRSDTPPLPAGLASLVANHDEQSRRPIDLTVTGEVRPLPPEANVALVRTAREALTNTTKHAPEQAVSVTLDYSTEQTSLTVSNLLSPGNGVRESQSGEGEAGGGHGLAGMRERLLLIGGTLAAGRTGEHWVVRARVPR